MLNVNFINTLVNWFFIYVDTFWIILIDKNSLSIAKYWNTAYSSIKLTTVKSYIKPYTKS